MGPQERDWIISVVKHQSTRYHKGTHKFGIKVPNTVDKAYTIHKATGTTFWCNAIELEMKRLPLMSLQMVSCQKLDHQYKKCHMIFDVKIKDFCSPAILTYAIIMSQETVCTALLIPALNSVHIWAVDVLNAYTNHALLKENLDHSWKSIW
ncbi:hypothetical protein ACHAW6_004706 [Cyclotella cf. meneghiniana]